MLGRRTITVLKTIGLIISVFVIVALALAIIPTFRDEIRWRWAVFKDNTENYESYIKSSPSGRYAAEAKARYDEHCWAAAIAANTTKSFEVYIRLQVQGKHVHEAIDSIGFFKLRLVLSGNSPSLLRDFLDKYPNSNLADTALRVLSSLEDITWATALEKNGLGSYMRYLDIYPDGAHVKEAKARIQILLLQTKCRTFVNFTDKQVETFIMRLENETYSTFLEKPIEYYIIKEDRKGGNYYSGHKKSKVVIEPSQDLKACSLHLKAGNLSFKAVYISTPTGPPLTRPLIPEKWLPTFTFTGGGGPGLMIDLPSDQRRREFKKFLESFSIPFNDMYYPSKSLHGYVIPDLLLGSDCRTYHDEPSWHYGHIFKFENENHEIVIKVDGVVISPEFTITNYEQAITLKTFLKTIVN